MNTLHLALSLCVSFPVKARSQQTLCQYAEATSAIGHRQIGRNKAFRDLFEIER
jgi:hypothetical protein